MCQYCGCEIKGEALLVKDDNDVEIRFCDEECAIYYFQEQRQKNFRTWVNIKPEPLIFS